MKTLRLAQALFAIACLFLISCQKKEATATTPPKDSTDVVGAVVTLTLDAKDFLKADSVEVPFKAGMKLVDVLKGSNRMRFELEDYEGMGSLVTGINGLKSNAHEGHYWQYCLNGTYGDRGIDDVELTAGMRVSWFYRAYGETPCKKIGE